MYGDMSTWEHPERSRVCPHKSISRDPSGSRKWFCDNPSCKQRFVSYESSNIAVRYQLSEMRTRFEGSEGPQAEGWLAAVRYLEEHL